MRADTARELETDLHADSATPGTPGTGRGDAVRGAYRYTLGEGTPWFLVVGEHVAVALRPPADPALVERLWSLVRTPATVLDDVLREIPGSPDGHSEASFVVVARTPDATQIFVHGPAVVDALTSDGWQRIGTRGTHPWRRDELSGVSAVTVGDPAQSPGDAPFGVSFALGSGVVVATRIDWTADLTTDAERTVAEQPAVAAQPSSQPDAVAPRATDHPGPIGLPPAAAVIPPAAAPVRQTPPLTHAPAGFVAPGLSEAETDTVIRPRRQQAVGQPEAPQQPAEHNDLLLRHDGETVLRRDIEPPIEDETVLRQKPFVPDDPQTVLYGFRINGGQAYPLDAVHYFGRNPRQPRIPLPDPSRLVPVVSASKSVSATHLEVKQVGDAIVATDLKSTNGTSVILPGKHWQRLRAGETVVVVPGTFIDIGDGNVIEILPPWPGA